MRLLAGGGVADLAGWATGNNRLLGECLGGDSWQLCLSDGRVMAGERGEERGRGGEGERERE